MQAKERRERHFKSTVGTMLNENHWHGFLPETVQHQDYIHIPVGNLPSSAKALEFLEKKFSESKPERVRSNSRSSDLYQAYRNVSEQPVGMVHYDREPYFWSGREKPASEFDASMKNANLWRSYDYIFNLGRENNFTPENSRDSAVSTPSVASKQCSSQVSSGKGSRSRSNFGHNGVKNQQNDRFISSGKPHSLRSDLKTPEKAFDRNGFKAYSPFTDTSFDYDVKEGQRLKNLVVQGEEKDYSEPISPPKYSDALNRVLDLSSAEVRDIAKYKNQRPADFMKLHGHPEYPSKVMDDKDVPNYIAWAKIYPYCPLTQKEGLEKPVFVPPRGFTPSTPSRPPTQARLKDIKKAKRNIMEGIKLLSSSSRKRQQQQQQLANQSMQKNANVVVSQEPTAVDNKKNNLLGVTNKLSQPLVGLSALAVDESNIDKDNSSFDHITVNAIENLNKIANSPVDTTPTTQAFKSIMYDPNVSRKVPDIKMKVRGGDTFYTGQTPIRTPSPDSRIALPANRAWVKHYSPARVQRFMAKVNKGRPLA